MGTDLETNRRLRSFSTGCAILSAIISVLAILGWLTNNLILAQFGPSYKPMPLFPSYTYLFLSVTLLIYIYRPFNDLMVLLIKIALLFVLGLSILILLNDYTDFHLELEHYLLHYPIPLNVTGESRVSPLTLVKFILIIFAYLFMFSLKPNALKNISIAAWLSFIVLILASINLTGYLYSAPMNVYLGGSQITTTAITSSLASFFLSLGIIAAIGKDHRPLSAFIGPSLFARLMRLILPVIIIFFIINNWINVNVFPHYTEYAITSGIMSMLSIVLINLAITKISSKVSKDLESAHLETLKTKEKLQDALSYNRSLIEASLDPLVTINIKGKITDVNLATELATGLPREQLIGSDFSKYFTDPEHADKGYKEVFSKGFVTDYALTLQSASGEKKDVLYNAVVYKDKNGAISGVFAAARDITEQNKAEMAAKKYAMDLERSNQELKQFAYIASHDLQEPLRVITSYLQLIERRYKDHLDQDANDFIKFAVDAAARLQNMINGLLSYSRVETQGSSFAMMDLNNVVQEAIDNLTVVIEETKALITYDHLPTLFIDASQMANVFQNLISNSIKFHKPDQQPIIHISAEKKDGEWVFSVNDNGIGIDLKYKHKLFIIFKRLVGAEYTGSGIGLVVCKRIIERHKGRIWVDSEVGKGSTFYFTIPE